MISDAVIDGLAAWAKRVPAFLTGMVRRLLRWIWETNDMLSRWVVTVLASAAVLSLAYSLPVISAIGAPTVAEAAVALLVIYAMVASIFGGSRYR